MILLQKEVTLHIVFYLLTVMEQINSEIKIG